MSTDIEMLIQKISRLPGLGQRSARRIVVHMLQHREKSLEPILTIMQRVFDNIKVCPVCGNIDTFEEACSICANPSRNQSVICIVESVSDLWALERTSCFSGQYHVLQGLLSSIEGKGPEVLLLEKLSARCEQNKVEEIIIALSATIEGQMTDNYIREYFRNKNIKITSLARGIPMGGELDYLDDSTLFTAFSARG